MYLHGKNPKLNYVGCNVQLNATCNCSPQSKCFVHVINFNLKRTFHGRKHVKLSRTIRTDSITKRYFFSFLCNALFCLNKINYVPQYQGP